MEGKIFVECKNFFVFKKVNVWILYVHKISNTDEKISTKTTYICKKLILFFHQNGNK